MKNALFIIVLSITLLSCSKDPVYDPSLLTTGTWKLTRSTTDYHKDGVYEEDTYATLAGCVKDNIHTFQSDEIAIIDEGSSKCESSDPQTRISSWSFSDKNTRFQFEEVDYEIEDLTVATFQLKGRVPYIIIFTKDVKLTFTKQ